MVRKELYVSSAILAGKSAYFLKASASTTSKISSNPSTFSHMNVSASCSSIIDLPSLNVTTLHCFIDESWYPGLVSLHVKLTDLTIFLSPLRPSFLPFWMYIIFLRLFMFCASLENIEYSHYLLYQLFQRVSLNANDRYCF